MEELKRDQLLELGFREYEDEPEVLYIDRLKFWGWETIEEIDFFRDINGLSSSAINHYTKILKRLEIW